MTFIETLIASFSIVFSGFVVFMLIALPIGLAFEKASNKNARKRQLAYRLANQCKGITKQGKQCLNEKDCIHHSN